MDAPTALLDPMAAGLAAVLDAGDRLTRALAMTELELPAGLDRLVGEARGAPLELTTRAWTGGAIDRLVIASIRVGGALRSATLIGLPRAASRVPILGVDLIALGAGSRWRRSTSPRSTTPRGRRGRGRSSTPATRRSPVRWSPGAGRASRPRSSHHGR